MEAQVTLRANPVELQQYGQHLYRNGEYEKAIEILGQALKSKPAGSVGILDNRVAAYLKLSKLDLALRDAKQMIKSDQQDERGYLRAAQVLVLMNKAEKALEMYAYGLKTLQGDHPKRALVQNPHDKLFRKLDARYRDPFHSLPLEIANMVLQYFDFRQTVAILRVSKRWEQFLSSVPWLWTRMDLSISRRGKIGYTAIRSYINRSKATLTHATLNNIPDAIVDRVLVLLSRCQKLIYLDIHAPCEGERLFELFKNSKDLKNLLTTSEVGITKALFANFLKELPNLEQFQTTRPAGSPLSKVSWPSQLPKLRSLSLTYTAHEVFHGLRKLHIPYHDCPSGAGSRGQRSRLKLLFESLPNLEDLSLHCVGSKLHLTNSYLVDIEEICYPKLRKLEITGLLIRGSSTILPASLEYMRFRQCRFVYALATIDQDPAPALDQVNPFGEQVDGDQSDLDSPSDQPRSHPFFPNLHTVIVDDIVSFSWEYFLFLLEGSESLKTFEISACDDVDGTAVVGLAESGPELGQVTTLRLGSDTSMLPNVNDSTIERLMCQMPSLKNLSIPWSQVTGVTIKNIIEARQHRAVNDPDEREQSTEHNAQQDGGSYNPEQQTETELPKPRPLPHIEFLDVRGCSGVSLEAINLGRKYGLKIVDR